MRRDEEYAALNEVPSQRDFGDETPEIDAGGINAETALEAMRCIENLYGGWGTMPSPAWSTTEEPF
jgi:hypothetical protein